MLLLYRLIPIVISVLIFCWINPSLAEEKTISIESQSSIYSQASSMDKNASKENSLRTNVIENRDPTAQAIDETGDGWAHWLKWLGIFLFLSVTLTPLTLYFMSGGNFAIFLASSAIVGAIDATEKNRSAIKGAADGAKTGFIICLVLVLLGPIGFLYCLYHPVIAFMSEADETYCCALTKLDTWSNIKRAISDDGHWLAEIKPTGNSYFGLGDKEFDTNFTLLVLDLFTGKHVKWTETHQKEIGVMTPGQESDIKYISLSDHLYIKPKQLVPEYEQWYQVSLSPDFLSNQDTPKDAVKKYLLVQTTPRTIELENKSNEQMVTIRPNILIDHAYLSQDGSILAVVETYDKSRPTDGFVSVNYLALKNYIEENWTIEFWEVQSQRKLATYHGHGINEDALLTEKMPDEDSILGFLTSRADGLRWYMVKEDGFIHVFDLTHKCCD